MTVHGLGALQYLHRYHRTGLGIGQRMVVLKKIVPAGGSDCLELMVGQGTSEMSP